jgi:signal transduction histidine kinase
MTLTARLEEPQWKSTWAKSSAWFANEFARDWDDPAARDAFARRTADSLGLDLELVDASGATLVRVGEACAPRHALDAPVARDGKTLGSVRACFHGMGGPRPHVFLIIGGLVLALWIASGRVARRLARPLDELATVVKRIGDGDLSARTEWSCYEPDEIGVVADAVNEMANRIEKQVKDQRELLATVSHELRSPFARVRVITELGRDGGASPKTWDDLDREVVDMDALVGELLASSRLEFGLTAVRAQPLAPLVTRALERSGVDPSRLAVEGGATEVTGDPTLLSRALVNLLENAKTHGGGVDQVRVEARGASVRFEVLDRGPGLPEGGEAALFEKFKKGSEGLGLGLSLVRRIAEAHRGEAFAKTREGGGAVIGFTIWSAGAPPAPPAPPTPHSSP